jgi:hypothetical protein
LALDWLEKRPRQPERVLKVIRHVRVWVDRTRRWAGHVPLQRRRGVVSNLVVGLQWSECAAGALITARKCMFGWTKKLNGKRRNEG